MLPGQNEIFLCPVCGHPVARQTLLSGNTFGAVCWTDGKREAPMLPEYPAATRCRKCQRFFFFDEPVKCDDPCKANALIENIADNLDWQECNAALQETIPRTAAQEIYLRIRLWWSANDRVRHPEKAPLPPCPEAVFRENLRILIGKLNDGSPDSSIMRAEAFRELGQFAEAKNLLRGDYPDDYELALKNISDLAERRETAVARMY